MFPFFETIQIYKGKPLNINLHQHRIDNTFAQFFTDKSFELQTIFNNCNFTNNEKLKCRIFYNETQQHIDLQIYKPKKVIEFKLIEMAEFEYSYKFTQRKILEKFTNEHQEILITQQGKITDTSYSNLIFLKENQWFTPNTFLLNGTQRQNLLQQNKISETEISTDNLAEFSHFKMINAMLDFESSEAFLIKDFFT